MTLRTECVTAVLLLTLPVTARSEAAANRPQPDTRKCMMVIGAHADDVEGPLAGGTLAKYKDDGYELVYVMSTNNAAGCLLNRSLEGDTGFTEKPVPHDYPVSALETIEIRNKEALDAAAFYGAQPVFLNFQESQFWPAYREVVNVGDPFYYQYAPPGRNVVSVSTRFSDAVGAVAGLLAKHRPEIVITHMTGGEKHDHGNTGYLVYLAFEKAMEKGAVGQLWMTPRGWVAGPAWSKRLAPYVKAVDVTPYVAHRHRALHIHVSQQGHEKLVVEPGKRYFERFLIVLDAAEDSE